MYPKFTAIFAIFYLISIQYISSSTNTKDSVENDDDNKMLRELLEGQVQLKSLIEKNDKKTLNMIQDLQQRMDQLDANIKNQSVVLEKIPAESGNTTPNPSKSLPTNCAEAMGESGSNGSNGIYKISLTNSDISPFDVYCMKKVAESSEENTINGTWLVFQRRQDNSTDFYLDWNEYQRGFGDLNGNFWIGLDKLYALTNSTKQELWVELEDHFGDNAWAKYGSFAIGGEDELYKLKTLDAFEGTAGDSLSSMHLGQNWSTPDEDNSPNGNCATNYKGAWWYKDCTESNLNGMYGETQFGKGIIWKTFRGFEYPLKYVHMAIRPKNV